MLSGHKGRPWRLLYEAFRGGWNTISKEAQLAAVIRCDSSIPPSSPSSSELRMPWKPASSTWAPTLKVPGSYAELRAPGHQSATRKDLPRFCTGGFLLVTRVTVELLERRSQSRPSIGPRWLCCESRRKPGGAPSYSSVQVSEPEVTIVCTVQPRFVGRRRARAEQQSESAVEASRKRREDWLLWSWTLTAYGWTTSESACPWPCEENPAFGHL